MVQIYEDQPSFASRLATGAVNTAGEFGKAFLGEKLAQRQQQEMSRQSDRENEEIKNKYGIDLAGIKDPKTREMILAEKLKGQGNDHGMGNAITALDKLEAMIDKKGIGFSGNLFNYGHEARRNKGEFSSLQSAVLPIFKSMFPRGMTEKEFKFVNENYIPQASDSEEKIRGKIQGLRQLVGQNGQGFEMNATANQEQNRPKLSYFGH